MKAPTDAPWLPYPADLRLARVLDRPNRFVLIASLDGGPPERVHLADPGRLTELGRSGWDLLVRGPFPAPACPWRAVAARVDGAWVSLRPTDANRLAARLVEAGHVPELAGGTLRAEAAHGRERFDLEWRSGERRALIEVKSASLVLDGVALFPDAVSARAARHVTRLAELAADGWEAWAIFVCQRESATVFRPADAIDPAFGTALRAAVARGLRTRAFRFRVTPAGVSDPAPIPVDLGGA
jgi:sugar fermentation stimulation protein A